MIGPHVYADYDLPDDDEDDQEDDGAYDYRVMYAEDSDDDICGPLFDGR